MKKMTYVEVLNKVVEGVSLSAEEVEKVVALRDSIAKRNATKSNAPTKAQKANAALREQVVSAMESGVSYSIKDICGLVDELHDATSQKVAPLMAALVDEGKVVKSVVKGKNFYALA